MVSITSLSHCVLSPSVSGTYDPTVRSRQILKFAVALRLSTIQGCRTPKLCINKSLRAAADSFIASTRIHRSLNTLPNTHWGSVTCHDSEIGNKKCSLQGTVSSTCLRRSHVSHSAVSASVASAMETSGKVAGEQFDWEKCWYPIASLFELDPKIPEPLTILGRPMVIWFDHNASKWIVFHDLCPHRLAPLSEGRIHESGQLQCSYHGWTFAADGSCGLIPQADKDSSSKLASSPRACARVYPSRVHQGVLWVWPDFSSQAALEAAAAPPPPTVPELEDRDFISSERDLAFFVHEVEYGSEMLVENLMDPAHIPFAHHNVIGNRNKVRAIDIKVQQLSIEGVFGRDIVTGGFTNFLPPCTIVNEFIFPGNKKNRLMGIFHCVPVSPGKSRAVVLFAGNFIPTIARKLLPQWKQHQGNMKVFDTDHMLVHLAERRLKEEGGETKAPEVYFVPTASDAMISGYRVWLKRFAGSAVKYPEYVDTALPPPPSKEELFDRQIHHVRFCRTCQRAQRGFELLRSALWAAAFAALLGLAYTSVVATATATAAAAGAGAAGKVIVNPWIAAAVAVVAGALAAAAARVNSFIDKGFHFQDFVHALND